MRLPIELRAELEAITAERGADALSETVIIALHDFVQRMRDPEYVRGLVMAAQLEQFRALCDRMGSGRTVAGAYVLDRVPDRLPGAIELPAVVTTGEYVLLIDHDGGQVGVSFGTAPAIITSGGDPLEVTLADLARLIGELSLSFSGLARGGDGAHARLSPIGLLQTTCHRQPDGRIAVQVGGARLVIAPYVFTRWAAELQAGLSRYLLQSLAQRVELEDRLAASPDAVEAPR